MQPIIAEAATPKEEEGRGLRQGLKHDSEGTCETKLLARETRSLGPRAPNLIILGFLRKSFISQKHAAPCASLGQRPSGFSCEALKSCPPRL